MSESIYFFDDKQQLIKIVNEDHIITNLQEKEITTTKEELLNSTLSVTIEYDEELKESAFVAVREDEDFFSLYRILKITDPENRLSFTGIDFAPNELDGYIVKDLRPNNESIESVAKRLIEGTEWRLGHIDSGLPVVKGSFYYISVKECLKQLQGYGCELLFKCTLNGDGVKDKWIEIYKQLGNKSNMRYTYGDKALTVVKELDRSQVYTSVIGRGRGEEVGDGYGRRLEFTNVEWKKSNGKPLDKPKGQNWLEMPEMTKIYGIPTKNGGMRKREKVTIFDDEEDENILLEKTYSELVECSRPLVQFSADVDGADTIGNTVTIHRYDRGYHYETRVFKLSIDRLTNVAKASIGDNLTSSMSRKTSQITNGLNYLDDTKQTFFEATEIGKYQDDIMRGAGKNGGSVYQVNGLEAGVSQSRETYETVYMDGPKIEESEHFMIQNSEGISFKQCKKGTWKTILDVHNGKSNTAWTLDGTFNANFIKAGVLEGIEIHSRNQNYDIKLNNGVIDFKDSEGNNIGAIRSLKKGDGDFKEGINIEQNEPYALFVRNKYKDGTEKVPLRIGTSKISGGKWDGYTSTRLEDYVEVKGALYIMGELYLNGKEITAGSGGSSGGDWNGQYPPELTTDQEKNAWFIWQFFKGKGWSEQSIAGMLGNMQSESGIIPDMDELSGGGGYGLTQWTPKSKLVDWCNGRGLDHRTIDAQCQRIQWEMENNVQWFPNPSRPDITYLSFKEFTKVTGIQYAADAFIAFYEHPADPYQLARGQQAQYWYDKLKDLKAPSANWTNPLRVGYVVTQEWDQIGWGTSVIHGGIDLAPTGGGNPPVYAAKGGTVTDATFDSTGGNYVVVDHGDGYWTYYGHMTGINVSVGQKVDTNTVLGPCGSTGLASGVHLHFEVWKGGRWQRINPRDVINF